MDFTLVALISYVFGSIPFGFLLTKIFLNIDIRKIGSGNIGATNALRTGNKLIAYSTLILDILKAVIPVLYIKHYYHDLIFVSALCAFLGHVFPIWWKRCSNLCWYINFNKYYFWDNFWNYLVIGLFNFKILISCINNRVNFSTYLYFIDESE